MNPLQGPMSNDHPKLYSMCPGSRFLLQGPQHLVGEGGTGRRGVRSEGEERGEIGQGDGQVRDGKAGHCEEWRSLADGPGPSCPSPTALLRPRNLLSTGMALEVTLPGSHWGSEMPSKGCTGLAGGHSHGLLSHHGDGWQCHHVNPRPSLRLSTFFLPVHPGDRPRPSSRF